MYFLKQSYIVLFSFLTFLLCISYPHYNWDIIGYTASAYSYEGLAGPQLSSATFQDLRGVVPETRMTELTTGTPYRETVARDPKALEQQLPFYTIRVLYVGLTRVVGYIVGSVACATILVSAAAAASMVLMFGISFLHCRRRWAFLLAPPLIALACVRSVGTLSTADAVAALGAVGLLLAVMGRRWWVTFVFLSAMPFFRTDFLLLSVICGGYIFLRENKARVLAPVSLAVLSYLAINSHFQNYGYLTIFNFTLISRATPYPAATPISTDWHDYLKAYCHGVGRLLFSKGFCLMAFSGALVAFFHHSEPGDRESQSSSEAAMRIGRGGVSDMYLISAVFVLCHFLLFPAAAWRNYFVAVWVALDVALKIFDMNFGGRRPVSR